MLFCLDLNFQQLVLENSDILLKEDPSGVDGDFVDKPALELEALRNPLDDSVQVTAMAIKAQLQKCLA